MKLGRDGTTCPTTQPREVAEYLHDRAWTLLGQGDEGNTHRRAMKLTQDIRQEIEQAEHGAN